MNRNRMITGQIIFRKSSDNTPNGDDTDRKLMMVVGVLAVPKDLNLKGEHKYTVVGNVPSSGIMGLYEMVDPDFGKISPELDEIRLTILPDTAEDLTEEITGNHAGGIITSHNRWRV